jgi:hypothetical protein
MDEPAGLLPALLALPLTIRASVARGGARPGVVAPGLPGEPSGAPTLSGRPVPPCGVRRWCGVGPARRLDRGTTGTREHVRAGPSSLPAQVIAFSFRGVAVNANCAPTGPAARPADRSRFNAPTFIGHTSTLSPRRRQLRRCDHQVPDGALRERRPRPTRSVDPDDVVPSSSMIVTVPSPRVCGPSTCNSSFWLISGVLIRFREVSNPPRAVTAGVMSTPAPSSAAVGPAVVEAMVGTTNARTGRAGSTPTCVSLLRLSPERFVLLRVNLRTRSLRSFAPGRPTPRVQELVLTVGVGLLEVGDGLAVPVDSDPALGLPQLLERLHRERGDEVLGGRVGVGDEVAVGLQVRGEHVGLRLAVAMWASPVLSFQPSPGQAFGSVIRGGGRGPGHRVRGAGCRRG